tara:strand:- start:108 stop:377 length:270 start_codon:yes stop_codon:yes gene_type:complete
MKEYNGHRSYNAWNVALWLHNDEDLYNLFNWMPEHFSLDKAVSTLLSILPAKTPDGAVYNRLSVKLAIQDEFEERVAIFNKLYDEEVKA